MATVAMTLTHRRGQAPSANMHNVHTATVAYTIASVPNRFVNRSATRPPPTAPTAPMAINNPYHLSLRCNRSWANNTKIAAVICMPRTDSPAAIASPRSTVLPDNQRKPSPISVLIRRRTAGSSAGRGDVAARSVRTRAAAIAKLAASKPNGSHTAATNRMLPSGVPMKLLAAISEANRRPLAFSKTSVGTMDGTIACDALSKNTSATPRHPAATHNIHMWALCEATAIANTPTTAARNVSARTINSRWSMRSTTAPIGSEKNSQGSAAATAMNEIASSLRVSRDASSGRATRNTPSPRLEIVLAVHKRQYAGERRGVTSVEVTVGRSDQGRDHFRMFVPHRWGPTLAAQFGSSRRSTLPDDVVGSASTSRISRGAMYIGNDAATYERMESSVGKLDDSAGTIQATTRCPHSSSSTPATATPATLGSAAITASTCAGHTFSPPVLITSPRRPSTTSRPSAANSPRSPVANHPSTSGQLPSRYERNNIGQRRWISPCSSMSISTPSSGLPS